MSAPAPDAPTAASPAAADTNRGAGDPAPTDTAAATAQSNGDLGTGHPAADAHASAGGSGPAGLGSSALPRPSSGRSSTTQATAPGGIGAGLGLPPRPAPARRRPSAGQRSSSATPSSTARTATEPEAGAAAPQPGQLGACRVHENLVLPSGVCQWCVHARRIVIQGRCVGRHDAGVDAWRRQQCRRQQRRRLRAGAWPDRVLAGYAAASQLAHRAECRAAAAGQRQQRLRVRSIVLSVLTCGGWASSPATHADCLRALHRRQAAGQVDFGALMNEMGPVLAQLMGSAGGSPALGTAANTAMPSAQVAGVVHERPHSAPPPDASAAGTAAESAQPLPVESASIDAMSLRDHHFV